MADEVSEGHAPACLGDAQPAGPVVVNQPARDHPRQAQFGGRERQLLHHSAGLQQREPPAALVVFASQPAGEQHRDHHCRGLPRHRGIDAG